MSKAKTFSLVLGGFVAGALISLHLPAFADKETKVGLPIDEAVGREVLGVHRGAVDVGENLEFVSDARVIAVG